MSYSIPAQPNTGMALDGDGITWTRGADGNYSATCQTCHTRLGSVSWPDLLVAKGMLEDVPLPPEAS